MESIKDDIANAMDNFISLADNTEDDRLYGEYIDNNRDKLPLQDITKQLSENPDKKISIQIKKEKNKPSWWWIKMISWPKIGFDIEKNLWTIIAKKWETWIEEWEIATYMTFEWSKSWIIKIKTQQLQIASKGALIPSYAKLSHKELTANEFFWIINNNENRNENEEIEPITNDTQNENKTVEPTIDNSKNKTKWFLDNLFGKRK